MVESQCGKVERLGRQLGKIGRKRGRSFEIKGGALRGRKGAVRGKGTFRRLRYDWEPDRVGRQ